MSKDKQIEEMRKKIHAEISKAVESGLITWTDFADWLTESLYNAGYRKQSEGEWYLEKETYGRTLCSNCNEEAPIKYEYNDERKGHLVYVKSSFCPNCGARMSGGKK